MRARKRIEKPENWTQNAFARGIESLPDNVHSRHAKSWCALGACQVECRHPDNMPVYQAAMGALQSTTCVGLGTVSGFNDTSTHAEVMAMYNEAIHNLQAGESQ